MRLTGIWQSNTRKQNGHYQSAKKGFKHVPFLYIRTRSTSFGTLYDDYSIIRIPVMNTRLDVADKDSYGVDSDNLDNFYFPVNRLKIGFIFPDGENRNLENAINPDEGFTLLAFNFYDECTNDAHTKYNGKRVDQITGSTQYYQHMGITPEAAADSYSGRFATQFSAGRLASQCFLSPQLYNEGGYSKGFYTAVPEGPYSRTSNFNLLSSDLLNAVEYHGSPYYRYFTIDCADNYTISMVFNKSIPYYSCIDTRIYTKGDKKDDYTFKNARRFITNDKFPISATEWSNTPNPSDILVRYNDGT